jgi:glyceraldehyde 3-phosphate dehydrogenase
LGVKVAINGFGRTGRLALRAAIERGSKLEFVAVNRGDAETLSHLLKYDSVHGRAPFTVEAKKDSMVVNGKPIRVLYESDAEKLPWREMGVDLVLECSDMYKDRDGASKHLKAGEEGPDLHACEETRPHGCPRGERPPLRQEEAQHSLQRLVHHELPGACGQGA